MRTKHIFYGLAITALAIGCQRKNEPVPAPADPVAGKGGKTQLRVTGKHFEKEVDTGTVYVKYNATSMPADMKFDDTANIKFQSGRYMVVFDSMARGNYFFYLKGRDLIIPKPNDSLWGKGFFVLVDTNVARHDVYINVINVGDYWTLQ